MVLRGMRYHPVDIENTVTRCHRSICERLVSKIEKIISLQISAFFQGRELSRFEPGGHLGVLFVCTGCPVFGRLPAVLQECRAIEHVAC